MANLTKAAEDNEKKIGIDHKARAVAGSMRTDGTTVAAKLLLDPGAQEGQARR
ncbi:hypothetical protein [Streptomyces rugosispiralis]|uniref:Uncharacterized protein n=1 Tax=Streptomyces rugosispiralis TaxID=2967341 RepID=A0ABT1UUH7_9ACTN|nr:hypothetical protein [Streptomyces rugosispiralis]MCQ8188473.1 hypothetical protein [Streptomyces rugosispiralis]